MTTELVKAPTLDAKVIEQVLLGGDLSRLSPEHRVSYYNRVCESLGLNPLTQPFAYIRLNGKEVLYAKKDATEQLRKLYGVSITEVTSQNVGDVFVVTAKAIDKSGRSDASTGAVAVGSLKGEALANALMKAETKAKRRVTLSICGLGMLDETETETVHADPPVITVEKPAELPPAPEGAVYFVQVRPERKGNYEWATVVLSTGEEVVAPGKQAVALVEQIAQEHAPVWLDTKKNAKGKVEIVMVHRHKPIDVVPEPIKSELTADQIPF